MRIKHLFLSLIWWLHWQTVGAPMLPPEQILPADTLGFFTIPSVKRARAPWEQMTLGRLWLDPKMSAFRIALQARFQESMQPVIDAAAGPGWTNGFPLPAGSLVFGWAPPPSSDPNGNPFVWMLGDYTENSSEMVKWWEQVRQRADTRQKGEGRFDENGSELRMTTLVLRDSFGASKKVKSRRSKIIKREYQKEGKIMKQ